MKIENNGYQSMITNQAGQRKTVNFADIFAVVSTDQMVAYRDMAFIALRVSMNENQWDDGRDGEYYKKEADAYNRIADVLDQMYGVKTRKREVLEIIG